MSAGRMFSLTAVTGALGIVAACGGAERSDTATPSADAGAGDASISPPSTGSSGGGHPGYPSAKGGPTTCTIGVTVYGEDERRERFTTCTFLSNVCPHSEGIYCGTGPKNETDAASDASGD